MSQLIVLSDEIKEALLCGSPIVALESTIIAHGLPKPRNLQTAFEIEAEVRSEGAIPATIAVLGGKLHVGLGPRELELLALSDDVKKLSTRDLAFACQKNQNGATTVSATMRIARLAGIRVFATGGIGGVHRNAENTLDISTDLTELAKTPVAVVCAGVKSILDLPKTLEYLETASVPTIGYRTNELPAFYSTDSGLLLEMRMDTPEEIAGFLHVQGLITPEAGALICNPAPEPLRIPFEWMEERIKKALHRAAEQGLKGKAITPFLLAQLNELTDGRSLETNVALVKSNAKLAARIAVAYSKI